MCAAHTRTHAHTRKHTSTNIHIKIGWTVIYVLVAQSPNVNTFRPPKIELIVCCLISFCSHSLPLRFLRSVSLSDVFGSGNDGTNRCARKIECFEHSEVLDTGSIFVIILNISQYNTHAFNFISLLRWRNIFWLKSSKFYVRISRKRFAANKIGDDICKIIFMHGVMLIISL